MKQVLQTVLTLLVLAGAVPAQNSHFDRFEFLLGRWSGTGSGFGNQQSKIESGFSLVMDGKYIQVKNHSVFEPTESKPQGEEHTDMGFFSYDKARDRIVYRQFNSEGYVNQYLLNDSLSSDSSLVFETEIIENFIPGGKARWTIIKTGEKEIETIFDVSFPGKEFACFGRNQLTRK